MAIKYCTGKKANHSRGRRKNPVGVNYHYGQGGAVQKVLNSEGLGMVSAHSSVPANSHGAPADPRPIISLADLRAQSHLISASVFTLMDSVFLQHNMPVDSSVSYNAYLTRFGPPERIGRQFRNRFSGAMFATENAAQQAELNSLSNRFNSLRVYLDGGIRYISNSRRHIRVGSCVDSCNSHPGWGAWTCDDRGASAIALCPPFWRMSSDSQRAAAIVHELVHLRYQYRNHLAGNERQRGRNPECYGSFLADMFGYESYSSQCPPV